MEQSCFWSRGREEKCGRGGMLVVKRKEGGKVQLLSTFSSFLLKTTTFSEINH